MKLHNIRKTSKGLASFGGFWKQGELRPEDLDRIEVTGSKGKAVDAGTRITAYWPDGTVKWTGHTALAEALGDSIEIKLSDNAVKASETFKDTESEDGNTVTLDNGLLRIVLRLDSDLFFSSVSLNGKVLAENARSVLLISEPVKVRGCEGFVTRPYTGRITDVEFEEEGPAAYVIKYTGVHTDGKDREAFPFIVRMTVGLKSDSIGFTHTFMYDGDENTDYLKGLGITFDVPMEGALYNRHVRFLGEKGTFHEALVHLTSWRPRIPENIYRDQVAGLYIEPEGRDLETVNKVMEDTPYWDEYDITENEYDHYLIKKKLSGDDFCYIEAKHGGRARGAASVSTGKGTVKFAIRDFWQKYPTGFNFKGLSKDVSSCTAWFWSPEAKPFDFRHYADRGYNQVCYEGYDYKGADPVGIAVTNECAIGFTDSFSVKENELEDFADSVNSPAVYVASPKFYHENKVLGYWSLPIKGSETGDWIEEQLDKAFEFYKNEVDNRAWYGMFNYGDFMHTYDPVRHCWKYDMGGYAWDNTELVPTLWLWLYFMRTGREDVFTLAEKLSRHASEVDVYHFGKYKGLGSRHNVRHWGCPCKEARIAMAGHHRYLYYLTCDRRFEDIFDELKDNEMSFLNKDPLGDFFDKKDMVFPSHARSGPDWSSLVSNWMTEWERHNDSAYRDKIKVGLEDIKAAPLKLSSGPDFEFDPKSCHLRYIGERTTGGTHLQVCMGAPSIWMETADLLDDEEFKEMIARHGRFYFLSHEEQLKESGGIIGDRQSTLPLLSCAMGAYGAKYLKDRELAIKTWKILLETMLSPKDTKTGFDPVTIGDGSDYNGLPEIPWVSTNFVAQFCLNAIMTAEFILDDMPKTLKEARELVSDTNPERLHRS